MRLATVLAIIVGMDSSGNIPDDAHGIEPDKCRVHELTTVDWIVCREKNAAKCPQSSTHGSVCLCLHPDRKRTLPLLPSTRPPPPPA